MFDKFRHKRNEEAELEKGIPVICGQSECQRQKIIGAHSVRTVTEGSSGEIFYTARTAPDDALCGRDDCGQELCTNTTKDVELIAYLSKQMDLGVNKPPTAS